MSKKIPIAVARRDIIKEAVGRETIAAKETIVIIGKEIEVLARITQEMAQQIEDREVEEFIISRMAKKRVIDRRFDLEIFLN